MIRTVTPHLQDVSCIHNDCILDRYGWNECVWFENVFYLQPTAIVLEEYGKHALVGTGHAAREHVLSPNPLQESAVM